MNVIFYWTTFLFLVFLLFTTPFLSFSSSIVCSFPFLLSFAISFVYLFLDFISHILLQYFSSNFTLPFSFSSISFHSLPYPFFFWSILLVSTHFSSIHSFIHVFLPLSLSCHSFTLILVTSVYFLKTFEICYDKKTDCIFRSLHQVNILHILLLISFFISFPSYLCLFLSHHISESLFRSQWGRNGGCVFE